MSVGKQVPVDRIEWVNPLLVCILNDPVISGFIDLVLRQEPPLDHHIDDILDNLVRHVS